MYTIHTLLYYYGVKTNVFYTPLGMKFYNEIIYFSKGTWNGILKRGIIIIIIIHII